MRIAKEKAESEAAEWHRVCDEAISEKNKALEDIKHEKQLKNELRKRYEQSLKVTGANNANHCSCVCVRACVWCGV